MAALSTNDAIDVAAILLADEAAPRLEHMPGHMRQLTGGRLRSYTDIVRDRIAALEASGFVRLPEAGAHWEKRRVHSTTEGVCYARSLLLKVASKPCSALLLWRALQRSLDGRLDSDDRSALMREFRSQHDAVMPAMADMAAANLATRTGADA